MMNDPRFLQRISAVFCSAVLLAAAWFWTAQVASVIETLRLAYG